MVHWRDQGYGDSASVLCTGCSLNHGARYCFVAVDRTTSTLANDPDATATQLPAVLNSLSGNDEDQLQWACETLENCHAPGAKQLPELLPFLKHDDALVVSWTCKLLTRMQPVAEAAQAALVDLLSRHPNELVREEAARALSVQTELTSAARVALEQAATDGGPRLKRIATAALER